MFSESRRLNRERRALIRLKELEDNVLLSPMANRLLAWLEALHPSYKNSSLWASESKRHVFLENLANSPLRDRLYLSQKSAAPFDLLLSFLHLHDDENIQEKLIQAYDSLTPGGVFLGILWGGNSLQEFRNRLIEVELLHHQAACLRISPMILPEDFSRLLQKASFTDTVIDVHTLELRYRNLLYLVEDLRTMGETAIFSQTSPSFSRAVWKTLKNTKPSEERAKIPITAQGIFFLARKPR